MHLQDIVMAERRGSTSSLSNTFTSSDFKEPSNRLSIIGAIDKFLQTIDRMEDTVMMPSRLLDVPLTDDPKEVFHRCKSQRPSKCATTPISGSTTSTNNDMYKFFTMLKSIRTDLVSGESNLNRVNLEAPSNEDDREDSGRDSLSSALSDTSSSASVCSEGSECSKMDEETYEVAAAFKYHITGLFTTLGQLTDAAQYLTIKYQDEIDKDASKIN